VVVSCGAVGVEKIEGLASDANESVEKSARSIDTYRVTDLSVILAGLVIGMWI
jgi:hypothetical protein